MSKSEEKIIRSLFEDAKNGVFPKFGSPEIRCKKCMFFNVACFPSPKYVGCYGGWKREEEQ